MLISPQKVLLCAPDHFQVTYAINPWMKVGGVDRATAKKQWLQLHQALQEAGVEVEVLESQPQLPDMVFATDQAVIAGKVAVMSSFTYPERQGETRYYRNWLHDHGFTTMELVQGQFEGGDLMQMGSTYFLGTGFRSNALASSELSKYLLAQVVPLELVSAEFYHLDTCFLPVNHTTAFYYPAAFSRESQQKLQLRVPHLIRFSEAQAKSFAANSLVIDRQVITPSFDQHFASTLRGLGFSPQSVNLSEFIKAGGAAHCLTLILETSVYPSYERNHAGTTIYQSL